MKTIPLSFLTSACLVLSAGAELVPGGDFQLYKPGSTTVTATLTAGAYAQWISSIPDPIDPTSLNVAGGSANYGDNTTGSAVDLLGWTKPQGGGDILANGPGGSMALNLFAAWGGAIRPIVETIGSLHTIGAGDTITISTMVGGGAGGPKSGDFFFSLYAGEVEVVPSSVVDQSLPLNEGFQMISRTYDADALAAHIGQSTKIRIAIPDSNTLVGRIIFDDVSIEGIGSGASRFPLVITPTAGSPGSYDLEWESQSGKLYNLRTRTDLDAPIATWDLVEGGIAATPPANLCNVQPDGPRRFYAVEEFDAPPPPPLFAADFEDNDGGFTVVTTQGSDWQHGTPASGGPGGAVNAGNGGSAKCWGTNIGNPGYYLNPTVTTLRSPVIDLTGVTDAELRFAEALDLEGGDVAQVFLIDAGTNAEIGGAIYTAADASSNTASWAAVGPINLAAGADKQIRLEWRLSGQAASADYMGWYIDDVTITATAP